MLLEKELLINKVENREPGKNIMMFQKKTEIK